MREGRAHRSAFFVACLLVLACSEADGPAPVAWDRTRCARCGMLVSEPSSAAQRRTPDGVVYYYDDPGCLLVSIPDEPVSTLYFHHRNEDRWLTREEVRFVSVDHTPMGYGLAAVRVEEAPSGLDLLEARRLALDRDRARAASLAPGARR